MGGMAFAIALKRQWCFEDFMIYERAETVGGTWRDNTYPGCSSDVPMHWYCFSTDMKNDWERPYALHDGIQNYLTDVSRKYSLDDRCVFNTAVVSADWDERDKNWHIVVENGATGERQEVKSDILISAVGLFFSPKFPRIPGLEDFRGEVFHSSRWRHDVNLAGKRVAVIGNGCSAVQFIPIISQDTTTTVVNFARTPMWFVPPLSNEAYSAGLRWVFEHIPLALLLYRALLFVVFEIRFILWFGGKRSIINKSMAWGLTKYLKACTPKKYHEVIVPNYAPGCKRLIINSGYLDALHRPNVALTFDNIRNITATGIVGMSGEELPFDAIICATGFVTDKYPIPIRGRTGQTVEEYWTSQGGPTAYYGTTLPGFPNFAVIAGPNASSGHVSLTFMEETQVNYALRVLKPVISNKIAAVEPKESATEAYNHRVQRSLFNSPFSQCSSWYRGGESNKIFSTWPGLGSSFWWQTLSVNWGDYSLS